MAIVLNSENNNNFAKKDTNNETNKRPKENQQFPEILEKSRRGKEASKTLAAAANNSRRSKSNDGNQNSFPKEEFLAHLEVQAHQQGTWIYDISTPFGRICNPSASNIRIFNPEKIFNNTKLKRGLIMAISETKEILIAGLHIVLKNKEVITAIALMLKTEPQMLTMIDWIYNHQKENPDEDRVIRIARRIQEQVS